MMEKEKIKLSPQAKEARKNLTEAGWNIHIDFKNKKVTLKDSHRSSNIDFSFMQGEWLVSIFALYLITAELNAVKDFISLIS